MQKKIITILISFFIFKCTFKSNSEGMLNELFIFTSDQDRILVEPIIDNYLSIGRYTPQKENNIKLKWKNINEISNFNKRYHLMAVSLVLPRDTTIDNYVNNIYNNTSSKDEHTLLISDVFANNQKFISIKAQDAIHLETIMDTIGNWIYDKIQMNINEQLLKKINNYKTNDKIEKYIQKKFNLYFPIQQDFMIIKEDTLKNNFLWIGRGVPYRWITIHETNIISSDNSIIFWKEFEKLINSTMPFVEISNYFKTQDFLPQKNIKRLKGIYGQTENNTGGPFTAYVYDIYNNDKTVFITSYVNNPGKDKLLLLKEMELTVSQARVVN